VLIFEIKSSSSLFNSVSKKALEITGDF
jgi:hypothetical protein